MGYTKHRKKSINKKSRLKPWLKNMYKASAFYLVFATLAAIYKQPVDPMWYVAQLCGFTGMWTIYYIFFLFWSKLSDRFKQMKELAEQAEEDSTKPIQEDSDSQIRY